MKKTSTPKPEVVKPIPKTKQLVSFDSLSKENQFLDQEEFIDDDYHSYTSSEELDGLKKIEEFEFNEVCTAYTLLVENQNTSNFENVILQKLNNIEQTMGKFKKDLTKVTKKVDVEQLQKHHDFERNKIENCKKHLEDKFSNVPQSNYQDILEIIADAIRNLNKEFEHKRRVILKRSEGIIMELVDDLYNISNASAREINHLCKDTAFSISKGILDVVENSNSTDLNLTHHCNSLLEKVEESFNENHECFNYENICKLLSDQLQVTQDELEALEEDNLDITLKYHDTQQAVSYNTNT